MKSSLLHTLRAPLCWVGLMLLAAAAPAAAPAIDPIAAANVPAGKSLIVPVTASSTTGRPLTFTATSSTNRIQVEVHTNNPFWKMAVVQAAPTTAPGAFLTPYRGGVVSVTNVGEMTFMLFRDLTPHTVDVISGLTAGGMYTSNTIFHRVIPGFMIQGGDPLTNGFGGPVFRSDAELHPRALFSGNGQLAMANSGKDTDGSQFFITAGPQRFLDFGYTLFGQLVRGFNVLTNVINTPTNAAARPYADVIITRTSLVPDPADTVLTLTASNVVGVTGTIKVIADDGAGGRATNTFAATTVADTRNEQPILYPQSVTNLVAPINRRLTNYIAGLDLEGDGLYWSLNFNPSSSLSNAPNSTWNSATGQLVIDPRTNYVGPISIIAYLGIDANWYYYDQQVFTFVIGDTAISGLATNFAAQALVPFTNRLVATFTNGVPNSAATNFTATINWGDNTVTSGSIGTNLSGRKEVRGAHTYTNAGTFPVYTTIQSLVGASATVSSTASVSPSLQLARVRGTNVVRWPAWATDYQLQSNTNGASTNWLAVTNLAALSGFDSVVTNSNAATNLFFRLKK